MTFLFAYLGSLSGSKDWPVHLMHQAEVGFVLTAVGSVLIIVALNIARGPRWLREGVAAIAGVSTSFALIMPLELAPFFFGVRGEIMMVTIALVLVYPIAALGFFFLFRRGIVDSQNRPPPLPNVKRN